MARIYVACLASYNAGRLHGAWIDADQDADAIHEEIAKILKASPEPNVTRRDAKCPACAKVAHITLSEFNPNNGPGECDACAEPRVWDGESYPSAEEFAIHDHEGFEGIKIGEYESIETVAELAAAIEEHGEVFGKLYAEENDIERARKMMEEGYYGAFKSLEAYAEESADDAGLLSGMPENLRCYFDFEAFARDMELNGDVRTIETDDGMVHVFDGCL